VAAAELTDPEATESTRLGRIGLTVVLTGAFIAMLDTFIVNVAVPSIRTDLSASSADADFVIAGYTLTYAAGLILGGRLGDHYGRRRLFLIGLAAFTASSALCGAAPGPTVLIVGRLIQGAAAALLTPQVLAIIRDGYPETRQRARAFALFGVVVGLASVAGQIVGGAVVQADLFGLAWRPVFLINLPLGVAALAFGRHIRDAHPPARGRLDWSGAGLCIAGLAALLYPLIEGTGSGWPAWTWPMLAAAALLLAAFGYDQARKTRRQRSPLLDTNLVIDAAFRLGGVLMLVFCATMPPLYLAYTVLAQDGYHASPLQAGLDFAPLALTFAVASFAAGRLTRYGTHRLLLVGTVLHATGSALALLLCLTEHGTPPARLIPAMILLGAGEGLFLTPVINTILAAVADHHVGGASGVLSTMQRLGNSLGLACLQIPFLAIYQSQHAHHASTAHAYTTAFAATAGCVLALSLIATLLVLRLATKPQRIPEPSTA
jgi:EmrB/QacA subfamily drug resistance transporter